MNRIQRQQQRRNEESSQAWERFAPHRARVTNLLRKAAGGQVGSLCVLGAGNCNDLDLSELLETFGKIELVDYDAAALQRGVANQQLAGSAQLRLHGDVDLCGVADLLAACTPDSPADDQAVDEITRQAASAPINAPPELFDVTSSVCLLSQLIDAVALALGPRHPRFIEVVETIRARHLRLLLELTRPGGAAVLIADIVSSDTLPNLPHVAENQLPAYVGQAIEQRNFFTGSNPAVLKNLLESDPHIAPLAEAVQISLPWRWEFGPRTYAVCALTARRRDKAA